MSQTEPSSGSARKRIVLGDRHPDLRIMHSTVRHLIVATQETATLI
jgi:hypothetical protein